MSRKWQPEHTTAPCGRCSALKTRWSIFLLVFQGLQAERLPAKFIVVTLIFPTLPFRKTTGEQQQAATIMRPQLIYIKETGKRTLRVRRSRACRWSPVADACPSSARCHPPSTEETPCQHLAICASDCSSPAWPT